MRTMSIFSTAFFGLVSLLNLYAVTGALFNFITFPNPPATIIVGLILSTAFGLAAYINYQEMETEAGKK